MLQSLLKSKIIDIVDVKCEGFLFWYIYLPTLMYQVFYLGIWLFTMIKLLFLDYWETQYSTPYLAARVGCDRQND